MVIFLLKPKGSHPCSFNIFYTFCTAPSKGNKDYTYSSIEQWTEDSPAWQFVMKKEFWGQVTCSPIRSYLRGLPKTRMPNIAWYMGQHMRYWWFPGHTCIMLVGRDYARRGWWVGRAALSKCRVVGRLFDGKCRSEALSANPQSTMTNSSPAPNYSLSPAHVVL